MKKSTSTETCHEHSSNIQHELHHFLAEKPALQLAGWFKGLSEANRVKIGYALTYREELCVHEISEAVGISVANASHHLRFMKALGLTKTRKIGTTVFYSLADNHVRDILRLGMDHMEEGT